MSPRGGSPIHVIASPWAHPNTGLKMNRIDVTMPISVCIVEDDIELSESMARYINRAPGFCCLGEYPSGEEALEEIPREQPEVVLMDINLPGMNGIECMRQLRARMPHVQTVMLTVYEDTDQVFQSLAAGAVGYLVKSTRPSQILQAIRDVHCGGSPMSNHIARKVVQTFQTRPGNKPGSGLSAREKQVLELLAKGCPYKLIAAEMGISIETIRTHLRHIYEKLHAHSRIEAVLNYLGQQEGGRSPTRHAK